MINVFYLPLGLVSYDYCLKIQLKIFERLVNLKKLGYKNLPNFLITCEHYPVYTIGRNGNKDNIKFDNAFLSQNNVDFYESSRGGDITFHGIGQLVMYPILDLENFFTDLRKYMRYLEELVIQTLKQYGICSTRIDGLTGVWIRDSKGDRKISALGVKMSRWVTMHGLALNVNTDLSYFNKIVPCGISDKGVTSIKNELGYEVSLSEVEKFMMQSFENVFNVELYRYDNQDEFLKCLPNEA